MRQPSRFCFAALHPNATHTELLSESIPDSVWKPSALPSCMLVFFSAHTHTRAPGSLRMLGCFFRQQPCGGNTQSVINHGRCLWEGSGTFLQHCTDKLHYHQLKILTLMRDAHSCADTHTYTHTLAYVLNISIMHCYLLYGRVLVHYVCG